LDRVKISVVVADYGKFVTMMKRRKEILGTTQFACFSILIVANLLIPFVTGADEEA
jgi:hypothetical protein